MFLAIDRVSRFTYVVFQDSACKLEGSAFSKKVAESLPCKNHIVPTDYRLERDGLRLSISGLSEVV